jgi:hypothetical protein
MNPRQQDKLLQKISLSFARQVKTEINRYIELVAKGYDTDSGVVDKYYIQHKQNLYNIWQKHIKNAIFLFGENTEIKSNTRNYQYKHVRLKPKGYKTFFDYLYTQWVGKNGGRHIQNIANTTRNKIRRIIETETQDEVDTSLIGAKIRDLKGFSSLRARTISLTETHNAAQYASHETATQLEAENDLLVYKAWVPVEDQRTREDHAEMADHEPILLHETFTVGDTQMERPGDENGGAEQVINCRCALVYETDD